MLLGWGNICKNIIFIIVVAVFINIFKNIIIFKWLSMMCLINMFFRPWALHKQYKRGNMYYSHVTILSGIGKIDYSIMT